MFQQKKSKKSMILKMSMSMKQFVNFKQFKDKYQKLNIKK